MGKYLPTFCSYDSVKAVQVEKLSISLPVSLVLFLEQYKVNHQLKSRSQVLEYAVKLLREQELENAYQQASKDLDPDLDEVIADGLNDETW